MCYVSKYAKYLIPKGLNHVMALKFTSRWFGPLLDNITRRNLLHHEKSAKFLMVVVNLCRGVPCISSVLKWLSICCDIFKIRNGSRNRAFLWNVANSFDLSMWVASEGIFLMAPWAAIWRTVLVVVVDIKNFFLSFPLVCTKAFWNTFETYLSLNRVIS